MVCMALLEETGFGFTDDLGIVLGLDLEHDRHARPLQRAWIDPHHDIDVLGTQRGDLDILALDQIQPVDTGGADAVAVLLTIHVDDLQAVQIFNLPVVGHARKHQSVTDHISPQRHPVGQGIDKCDADGRKQNGEN